MLGVFKIFFSSRDYWFSHYVCRFDMETEDPNRSHGDEGTQPGAVTSRNLQIKEPEIIHHLIPNGLM